MLALEESFNDERTLIERFASGDAKDVITLNVSGTMMVTTRSTLCRYWKQQGCNGPPVNEWTPDRVSTWAKNVDGLPEEVIVVLYENIFTGRELLALSRDNLKMMGTK